MTKNEQDTGLLAIILENFNHHTFARLSDIKDSVEAGGKLAESEIEFLEAMNERANRARALIDRNEGYHELFAKVVQLYKEIVDRAMENEKQR